MGGSYLLDYSTKSTRRIVNIIQNNIVESYYSMVIDSMSLSQW